MNNTLNTYFSDYIVPIRYNSILLGTGIIHKSLLITAAHVVEELKYEKWEFSFLYHEQPSAVNWDSVLFFEYDKEKHNYYRDLAIFRTRILQNGLFFEPIKKYNERTASIFGYYEDAHANIAVNSSSGEVRMKPVLEKNIPLHKNTFLLMDIANINDCNSGCPLLNSDKKVLGILSAGNQDLHYARFVSSDHIKDVLDSERKCKDALLEYDNSRTNS